MYKLVVLLLVAAAAADPSLVYRTPLLYPSVYVPKTIITPASSVLQPSPVVYSPFGYSHFIKKRSVVQDSEAGVPTADAGVPTIETTILHDKAPLEKRSTFFYTPTTYATATPLITKYASYPYFTPIIRSTPYISTPIYSHFIKKRSAPLLTTYVAPTSFSHQSRVDINHSPIFKVATFPTPLHSFPYIY